MCDEYNPSDSLNTISDTSLPLSEPDSPESNCLLVFRNGEWQMPLDEGGMSYQSLIPKGPPALFLHQVIFPYTFQ